MGYGTIRKHTTKEERVNKVIEKGNPAHSNLNKISSYLSQPNVKEFNAILVDKAFKTNRQGRPHIFESREECENEVTGYFKLCYDYDMIPTVSSLVLYLGMNRDTFYDNITNKMSDFSDVLKKALDTCHAYQEQPALEGRLVAPTWIFTAKNYFNMKDTQSIDFTANNGEQPTHNSINAIKDQIENEQTNVKFLE